LHFYHIHPRRILSHDLLSFCLYFSVENFLLINNNLILISFIFRSDVFLLGLALEFLFQTFSSFFVVCKLDGLARGLPPLFTV